MYVTATSGSLVRDAKTDTSGNFEIHDLQAGTYTLVLQPPSDNPRNSGPPPTQAQVTVRDGATEHVNVLLDPYTRPVDRGPCCKPYGAPPARRRVV